MLKTLANWLETRRSEALQQQVAQQHDLAALERVIRTYLAARGRPASRRPTGYRHVMDLFKRGRRTPAGYHYASMADFLLTHGRMFKSQVRPGSYPQAAPGNCFLNCAQLATRRRLRYVEGVVLVPRGVSVDPLSRAQWKQHLWEPPVHHAWCLDPAGGVVDITLPGSFAAGCRYFGVVVPEALVGEIARELNGQDAVDWFSWNQANLDDAGGGVLDDRYREWPILKHPFTEV